MIKNSFAWMEDRSDRHTYLRAQKWALSVGSLHVLRASKNGPHWVIPSVAGDRSVKGFDHQHDHTHILHRHSLEPFRSSIGHVVSMIVYAPILGFAIVLGTLHNAIALSNIPKVPSF